MIKCSKRLSSLYNIWNYYFLNINISVGFFVGFMSVHSELLFMWERENLVLLLHIKHSYGYLTAAMIGSLDHVALEGWLADLCVCFSVSSCVGGNWDNLQLSTPTPTIFPSYISRCAVLYLLCMYLELVTVERGGRTCIILDESVGCIYFTHKCIFSVHLTHSTEVRLQQVHS